MTYNELTKKATELKELKVLAEELKNQIAALEDEVKQEMTNQGTDTILAGPVKITWKSYTSKRFDTTGCKKDHADMYAEYTKQVEAKRFLVA